MPSIAFPRAVRRASALGIVAATATLLSGCFAITDQSSTQADVVGDVQVHTSICLSGTRGPQSSPNEAGCDQSAADMLGDMQLLVAYLVPDDAVAPDTLTTSGGIDAGEGPSVTFTRSSQYSAIVAADASPAETGEDHHWVGYASTVIPKLLGNDGGRSSTIDAAFGADALDGDLTLRTKLGYRWVQAATQGEDGYPNDDAWPADRPIDCGTATTNSGGFPPTFSATAQASCEWSSFPKPTSHEEQPPVEYPADYPGGVTPDPVQVTDYPLQALPTNHLTLDEPNAAAQASSAHASEVALSFPTTTHWAGANEDDAQPAVPATATTEVPGAAATVSDVELGNADGGVNDDRPTVVTVNVPAGTPSGSYGVALKVGEGTGVHQAVGTIQVVATGNPAQPTPTPAPTPGANEPTGPQSGGAPAETPTPAPPAAAAVAVPAPKTIVQKLTDSTGSLVNALAVPKKLNALRKGGSTKLQFSLPGAGVVNVKLLGQPKKKGGEAPRLATGKATSKGDGQITELRLVRTDEGKKLLRKGKTIKGSLVIKFAGRTVTSEVTLTLD